MEDGYREDHALSACETVCSRAAMSWTLPTSLLHFAGAVATWPLAAVVRRPTSPALLVAEAFSTTLVVIGLVQLIWIALLLIEQRW